VEYLVTGTITAQDYDVQVGDPDPATVDREVDQVGDSVNSVESVE
jgi:hypothetical protein